MIRNFQTTFKGFHEISIVNGVPTQILIFVKSGPNFRFAIQLNKTKKSKLKSLLHMYDVYVTSCATFLLKRFFLASVYLYFRMVFAIYTFCQADSFSFAIVFCVFLFFVSVVGFISFIMPWYMYEGSYI